MAGAHGSGKTTICRALAPIFPAVHVTAGDLIRQGAGVRNDSAQKAVADVNGNQSLLLQGLERYRAQLGEASPLLLDGHFALLGPTGEINEIPLEVFVAIRPVAVVLVEVPHQVLQARLAARDGVAPPGATLAALVDREREHAASVCHALQIPMALVTGNDSDSSVTTAAAFVRRVLIGAV